MLPKSIARCREAIETISEAKSFSPTDPYRMRREGCMKILEGSFYHREFKMWV